MFRHLLLATFLFNLYVSVSSYAVMPTQNTKCSAHLRLLVEYSSEQVAALTSVERLELTRMALEEYTRVGSQRPPQMDDMYESFLKLKLIQKFQDVRGKNVKLFGTLNSKIRELERLFTNVEAREITPRAKQPIREIQDGQRNKTSFVLVSLPSDIIAEILSGEKVWEFRAGSPKRPVSHIFFYNTNSKSITASAQIGKILRGGVIEMIRHTEPSSFYDSRGAVTAIQIIEPKKNFRLPSLLKGQSKWPLALNLELFIYLPR